MDHPSHGADNATSRPHGRRIRRKHSSASPFQREAPATGPARAFWWCVTPGHRPNRSADRQDPRRAGVPARPARLRAAVTHSSHPSHRPVRSAPAPESATESAGPPAATRPSNRAHLLFGQLPVCRIHCTPAVLAHLLEHRNRRIPLRYARRHARGVGLLVPVTTHRRPQRHQPVAKRLVVRHQFLIDRDQAVYLRGRELERGLMIEQLRDRISHAVMHVMHAAHATSAPHHMVAAMTAPVTATRRGREGEQDDTEHTDGLTERHGDTSANGLGQARSARALSSLQLTVTVCWVPARHGTARRRLIA